MRRRKWCSQWPVKLPTLITFTEVNVEDGTLVELATAAVLNALGDNNEVLFVNQVKMNAKNNPASFNLYCCMMNVGS